MNSIDHAMNLANELHRALETVYEQRENGTLPDRRRDTIVDNYLEALSERILCDIASHPAFHDCLGAGQPYDPKWRKRHDASRR